LTVRDYDREEHGTGLVKPYGIREEGGKRYIIFQVWDIPIVRIVDVPKAKDFYCGFLGFTLDWSITSTRTHGLHPGVAGWADAASQRASWRWLSRLDGVCVDDRIDEFHREITSKGYKYLRPASGRRSTMPSVCRCH